MNAPAEATRCVVLTPTGAVTPALGQELDDLGWHRVEVADPCMAMAELCVLTRTQASRAAWGLQRPSELVLVVAAPAEEPAFGELKLMLEAVRVYLPDVTVWLSSENALARLTPEAAAEPGEHPPTGLPETAGSIDGAATNAAIDGATDPRAMDELPERPRISAEELAMLFGRDRDEDDEVSPP